MLIFFNPARHVRQDTGTCGNEISDEFKIDNWAKIKYY